MTDDRRTDDESVDGEPVPTSCTAGTRRRPHAPGATQRWNGWGAAEARDVPLPPALSELLRRELGPGLPGADAPLARVLLTVPPSRLPAGAILSDDPFDRLRHARGQSFPDLVALRAGSVPAVPDAVAFPRTSHDVRAVLGLAAELGASVVPYGGGTSVVGGVTTPESDIPQVTVDLRRMNRLLHVDEASLLATFGPGVTGPHLEAALRARGLTLGHYPQSFERSTLGGWVATRSSGQQSLGSGRIEELFAGGRLESPGGELVLSPFPASAAGPDLRQVILGSEGRLGVLTEVTVRVRRLPEVDEVAGAVLPDWDTALNALRALAAEAAGLSVLRLSTPAETGTSLLLAGRAGVAVGRLLTLRRLGSERCLLLVGTAGTRGLTDLARQRARRVVRRHGGLWLGKAPGRQWQRNRFRAPYLRDSLWSQGYGVDSMETAAPWSAVPALVAGLEAALHAALDGPVHVGTHLSHVYPTGSSVYSTVVFRLGDDPAATLQRWRRLKTAATGAVLAGGGTITHQHGVGVDHRDALVVEKGPLGIAALAAVAAALDRDGRMNPGKLLA